MIKTLTRCALAALMLSPAVLADGHGDDPIAARQEIMKGVRGGAKDVGGMLRGEAEFDAAVAMQAFETWRDAAAEFGGLFPKGSETGGDTEALETIWTDRAGFDQALADFAAAVDGAIVAAPADLQALKGAAGPVFQACKGCHETYRADDDG